MEKIILVSKVEKLSKGKGSWIKISYNDNGKERSANIFPKCEGYNLIADKKMLKLTLEKNEESGYWDIIKVENAGDSLPGAKEPLPSPSDNLSKGTQTGQGKDFANGREESIEQQVAAKIIGELWIAGKLADNHALVSSLQVWLDHRITKGCIK